MDNRGVSQVLSYSFALTISTILVAGLLIAGGGFVDDQRTQVVNSELEVIGQRLASDIASVDRLARTGTGPSVVRLEPGVPAAVAGAQYDVEVLTNDGNASLQIESPAMEQSVVVPVSNTTAVAPGTVTGGDIVVEYDPTADHLEVTNG